MNAKNWTNEFPKAAVALVENHCVDDYLDSRYTAAEMTKLAADEKSSGETHSSAERFHL